MRILQIAHGLPPDRVAGVEVYTDEIAHALSQEHEVAVLYAAMAPGQPNLRVRRGRRRGFDTFELVNNHRYTGFEQTFRHRAIDARMIEVLDEFRPDVVHIQHLLDLSIGVVDELVRRGVPSAMTLHDHWLTCANGGQRFHRQLGRCDVLDASRCGACTAHMGSIGLIARGIGRRRGAALRTADRGAALREANPAESGATASKLRRLVRAAVSGSHERQAERIEQRWQAMRKLAASVGLLISPSRYLADELGRFGLPKEKMRCMDYGFSKDRFPTRAPLPETARRFGFLGSLVPHKGAHHLIDAFNSMPPEAELQLCGSPNDDPGYAAALRRATRHPGVRFVGGRAPESVPEFLQGLDCLVVPSIWHENSPLCIHEAFLTGVPVVASRMGGQADLLAGGGGWLYPADEPGQLQTVLLRIHTEPGLLREAAARIPAVVLLAAHVKQLAAIYDDLRGGAQA